MIAENGGGAFVLLYLGLAFFIGSALIIGELMLGKLTRRSAISASEYVTGKDPELACDKDDLGINRFFPKKLWKVVTMGSVVAASALLIYYTVISGWVLHYFMQMLIGQLRGDAFSPEQTLMTLRDNIFLHLALMSVHFILIIFAVIKGIRSIEKWIVYLIPFFATIFVLLLVRTLELPTSTEALRYLFYPDFSKMSLTSPLEALGHVCLSLSIGFGTMITFGSYMREDAKLPTSGFRVASIDTIISLLSILLIFPLVVGASFAVSGPELVFQTLPRLFLSMSGGTTFGVLFYLCLYLSTFAASVMLMESVVSNFIDFKKWPRKKATWVFGGIAFFLAIFPALTTGPLRHISIAGRTVLEALDRILVNGLLPLLALFMSSLLVLFMREERKKEQFIFDDSISSQRLFKHWQVVITYVAPIVILSALLMALVSFFLPA